MDKYLADRADLSIDLLYATIGKMLYGLVSNTTGKTLYKKSLCAITGIWLLVSNAIGKTLYKKLLCVIIGMLYGLVSKTLYKILLYTAKRTSIIGLALGRYLE